MRHVCSTLLHLGLVLTPARVFGLCKRFYFRKFCINVSLNFILHAGAQAAVDLSSVGPQVGEPRPVDDQRRFDVERHDRELLGQFATGDSSALLEEVGRTHNPTRWSGLGPMAMILDILQPTQVELIDYRQMMLDDKGMAMITDASLTLA